MGYSASFLNISALILQSVEPEIFSGLCGATNMKLKRLGLIGSIWANHVINSPSCVVQLVRSYPALVHLNLREWAEGVTDASVQSIFHHLVGNLLSFCRKHIEA